MSISARGEAVAPYLRVDLPVFEAAARIERSAGLPRGTALAGLLEAWKHCWDTKTDVVNDAHLRGFFGTWSGELGDALVSFGFLEVQKREGDERQLWRIKGAHDRIIRVQESLSEAALAARRKGGLAARGNLKQNRGGPVQPDMLGGADKPAGKAPRKPSAAEAAWAEMCELTAERLLELGREDAKPQAVASAALNSIFKRIYDSFDGLPAEYHAPKEPETVVDLWRVFLRWEGAAEKDFPLELFASPKVLRRCMDDWQRELEQLVAEQKAAEAAA